MERLIDFCKNEVKAGDWLVLPSSSSNMNPFRFVHVLKFGSTGKPFGPSFEYLDAGWRQSSSREVTVHAADKAWAISRACLPEGLIKHLDELA